MRARHLLLWTAASGGLLLVASVWLLHSIAGLRSSDRGEGKVTLESDDDTGASGARALIAARVCVVVWWTRGNEPSATALDRLAIAVATIADPSQRTVLVRGGELGGQFRVSPSNADYRRLPSVSSADGSESLSIVYEDPPDSSDARLLGQEHSWIVSRGGSETLQAGLSIYPKRIVRLANRLVSRDAIEATVLIHEFGHTLGLVTSREHMDSLSHRHCTALRCVMGTWRWSAVLANAPSAVLFGALPTEFCAACRGEIKARRSSFMARGEVNPRWMDADDACREALALVLEARTAIRDGDGAKGDRQLRLALEKCEESGIVRVELARRLWAQGMRAEALPLYISAARLSPSSLIPVEAADALAEMGRFAEIQSVLSLRQAFSWRGSVTNAYGLSACWSLALAMRAQGRMASAVGLWERYADDPEVPDGMRRFAQLQASSLLRAMGEIHEAQRIVNGIRRDSRNTEDLRIEEARLAEARGELDAMRRLLERIVDDGATRDSPNATDTWAVRGRILALALLGRSRDVRAELAKVSKDNGSSIPAWPLFRAKALSLIGDIGPALDALAEAKRATTSFDEVCFDENLAATRRDPRFLPQFPQCGVVTTLARSAPVLARPTAQLDPDHP